MGSTIKINAPLGATKIREQLYLGWLHYTVAYIQGLSNFLGFITALILIVDPMFYIILKWSSFHAFSFGYFRFFHQGSALWSNSVFCCTDCIVGVPTCRQHMLSSIYQGWRTMRMENVLEHQNLEWEIANFWTTMSSRIHRMRKR